MNILLSGCTGLMGAEVIRYVSAVNGEDRIIAGVGRRETGGVFPFPTVRSFSEAETKCDFLTDTKKADVIIDFSSREVTAQLLRFAVSRSLPTVICTTGQTESDLALIRTAAKRIPVFLSANMSTGVALLAETVKNIARALPECEVEIIEYHRAEKADAPSGTALMLADAVKSVRHGSFVSTGRHGKRRSGEITVHSVRLGGAAGKHEMIFGSYNQTVTVTHEAHGRAMYADGAVRAASFLIGKQAGLYSMNDLLGDKQK